jgi:hypothetical protein
MWVDGEAREEEPMRTDFGEILAKAGERSTHSLRVPMGVGERQGATAKVWCAIGEVRVHQLRGSGAFLEVVVSVDSKKSGVGELRARVRGKGTMVEGTGKLIIAPADPIQVRLTAVFGQVASASIPLYQDFWQAKQYVARFNQPHKELWVMSDKGEIPAGAQVLPFKILYKPRSSKAIEAMLIVDCGDFEISVGVSATPCGFGISRAKPSAK